MATRVRPTPRRVRVRTVTRRESRGWRGRCRAGRRPRPAGGPGCPARHAPRTGRRAPRRTTARSPSAGPPRRAARGGARTRSARPRSRQRLKVPCNPMGASPMPSASARPSTRCRSSETGGTARQKVTALRGRMRARVMLATGPSTLRGNGFPNGSTPDHRPRDGERREPDVQPLGGDVVPGVQGAVTGQVARDVRVVVPDGQQPPAVRVGVPDGEGAPAARAEQLAEPQPRGVAQVPAGGRHPGQRGADVPGVHAPQLQQDGRGGGGHGVTVRREVSGTRVAATRSARAPPGPGAGRGWSRPAPNAGTSGAAVG